MTRTARVLGALAFAGALLAPTAAHAADDAQIDHSEFAGDQVKMLVSVPGTDRVDLDSVSVQIGGVEATATAEPAGNTEEVRRTTILAMDTSNSMTGARIAAAKEAALAYLDLVPENVEVGIVSFNATVEVEQAPASGAAARARSREVIEGLELALTTRLYDGVAAAAQATGDHTGQRQVLVLSDGREGVVGNPQTAIKAIKDTGVLVDAVYVAGGSVPPPLTQIAQAGEGEVIQATAANLAEKYAAEAEQLARQVLVTATIPEGVSSTSASVALSLTAGGEPHTTEAFLAIREGGGTGVVEPAQPQAPKTVDTKFDIPAGAMYGALAAIFLGAIGVVWAFSTGGQHGRLGVADQIAAYGTGADRKRALKKQSAPTDSIKETAKAAAESMLASNQSLEARIANRLEGAGLAVKAPEWILIHAGVAILVTLVGILAGGGTNVPLMVMFAVFGIFAPWAYLSFKRSRRLKAFHENLADTLQLMSGSLSAGLSLAQSLDTIVREGTEPMTGEFKRVIAETRLGVGLEDALEGVAQRMDSKDFTWVIMAIRIQREVGGNLAELLLTVAATLREREYLRRQVRALSAEGRLSAYILGGLPPVFLLYLTSTKPEYVEPMFTTPVGWLGLGVMAVLLVVGFIWMMKVAKVEV